MRTLGAEQQRLGGADTTVSAIYSFFLAMTLFPHVLKRAQEEIDSVIGSDRLPAFEDRPNLPYVEALVKEVFRWNPVAPLGKSITHGARSCLTAYMQASRTGCLKTMYTRNTSFPRVLS